MHRFLAALLSCTFTVTSLFMASWHIAHADGADFSDSSVSAAIAAADEDTIQQIHRQRMAYYAEMAGWARIPWYYFAAVDQFERNVQAAQKKTNAGMKSDGRTLAIAIPPTLWSGWLNPDPNDTNPDTIRFFGGIGQDGNGDGIADPNNDDDVVVTFLTYMSPYFTSEEDFLHGLWEYYGTDSAVRHIKAFAAIYRTFQRLDLDEYTFPIPRGYNYTYHDTWGHARGWGGRRMHEGTDIFAAYGTPVRSVGYGYVEVVGWNKYGGWRVGIRDLRNIYHYYAHLSGFEKSIRPGKVVKPGEIIGYVGNSGYGKPGTQGKFPPHLHYGMYKFDGRNQWAFDPYPYLKTWERADRWKKR